MEDARRFIRYVLPGLVFMTEVSLYMYLSNYQAFVNLMPGLEEIVKMGLAAPASAVLVSAAIGFLLASGCDLIYRIEFIPLGPDPRPLINDAVSRGWLQLERRDNGDKLDPSQLTRTQAWNIFTSLWRARTESSFGIKGGQTAADGLSNLMHGAGAMFVGTISAMSVWSLFAFGIAGTLRLGFCTIPLVALFLHYIHFRVAIENAQNVVDMILANELRREFDMTRTPTIVQVPRFA